MASTTSTYYNKWFVTKVLQKFFGKDSKYMLKVRMQEVSAVQEYSDVHLHDGRHFPTTRGGPRSRDSI